MALDLTDCQFQGPALPEPFVKFELEKELTRRKLLAKTTGVEGKALQDRWAVYRRKLRDLAASGGSLRVRNHVIDPLVELLGFSRIEDAEPVQTREDREAGGMLLLSADGTARLRVWTTSFNEDLYAPAKRGRAYRYSHLRVAQRVLLATGDRAGLLTNGVHLMLLVSDPARPDSAITIPLDPGWKRSRDLPDSFRFLLAVASPQGLEALPDIVDKARLHQTRVTKELRVQARQAVERFVQEVLDHPDNRAWLEEQADRQALARDLWREGLIIIYRLLFILKGESSDDPARTFNFASTSLWRTTYSPSMALAPYARDVIERGVETGKLLEDGLRSLFRMFEQGMECTELVVKPLGGALFGVDATPTLAKLAWGERAVAWLLDRLLWTPKKRGGDARERVHYGSLWVEDLGRVYEALLELEPGISTEPMCRLRRQKLEVVVPLEQGEPYQPANVKIDAEGEEPDTESEDEDESEEEDETPRRGKKTKVEWIEAISPGRFYLRVGLGRKASGSYYTPHSFVRFLVQETLGPQVAERSPNDDPKPGEILKLKVLDPAMGSGHFLVEACRFLGAHLYEAARLCDEKALDAERRAERAKNKKEREAAEAEAHEYRQRVIDLPDPDDAIVRYLPSRSPEGEESGVSQRKAEALCRRMVAVHCLYGVDKNPLAVELAKLALWLESHAEGMPLTFLDHRLVVGDSLTGPFWDNLTLRPGNPKEPVDDVINHGLTGAFTDKLAEVLSTVRHLEDSVGVSLSEMEEKERLNNDLDRALRPFKIIAAAWSGGVKIGSENCDDLAYADLLKSVAQTGEIPMSIDSKTLRKMISCGLDVHDIPSERSAIYELITAGHCVQGLPYDLAFPDCFYPSGVPDLRRGFDAILGNPPWDQLEVAEDEFWAHFDIAAVDSRDHRKRQKVIARLISEPSLKQTWEEYERSVLGIINLTGYLYHHQSTAMGSARTTGRPDVWRLFAERFDQLLDSNGYIGTVLPSAFHNNEGATGIRRLYLDRMNIRSCYSFENRRALFDIHRSFKFALIVACGSGPTQTFQCAFYLHDDEWLFADRSDDRELTISRDDFKTLFGHHLVFMEARNQRSLSIIRAMKLHAQTVWKEFIHHNSVSFSNGIECHRRPDLTLAAPAELSTSEWLNTNGLTLAGTLPLVDGKNINQYSIETGTPVGDLGHVDVLLDSAHWRSSIVHYRVSFRYVAASTNERTVLGALLPPGLGFANGIVGETTPSKRPNSTAVWILGLLNSYCFDYQVRQQATTHVNRYILASVSVVSLDPGRALMSHSALRLACNHEVYKPLWREQLGGVWREAAKKPFTWPVFATDDERWEVRAAIDAVVANAYGLSLEQYEHVLSTFSHAGYPKAPKFCLAKFDELKCIGLDAFTRKYDPYHDIPLNENLPQPVIDLPLPEASVNAQTEVEL